MYIYDLWDEQLYERMLRRSPDMRRSRDRAAPKIGGEGVADKAMMGAFMGLHKHVLIEDDEVRSLSEEAVQKILRQVVKHDEFASLREITKGDRFLSSVAASSIVDSIVQLADDQANAERMGQGGQSRRRRARTADSHTMDKIGIADQADEAVEFDEEVIDQLQEMARNGRTKSERNAAESAVKRVAARKAREQAQSDAAKEQARKAIDGVADRASSPTMKSTLARTAEQLSQVAEAMEDLHEAGLLDYDTDDLIDDGDDGSGEEMDQESDEFKRWNVRGGWGANYGAMSRAAFERVKRASEALAISKQLAEIANEVGRIRAVFRSSMKPAVIAGNPGAVEGVSYGQKISQLTSAGLATLSPRMRTIFRVGFAEESLPEREMWGPDLAGRGPIIVAVDSSGSMNGQNFFWAKALAMALLAVAKEQGRDFAWLGFSNEIDTEVVLPEGKADMAALMKIEQAESGGGTSFASWMTRAVELIEQRSEFKRADIVLISDGAPNEHLRTDEEIDQHIEYAIKAVDEDIKRGYVPSNRREEHIKARMGDTLLYRKWKETRERLGFRVKGIFIQDQYGRDAAHMIAVHQKTIDDPVSSSWSKASAHAEIKRLTRLRDDGRKMRAIVEDLDTIAGIDRAEAEYDRINDLTPNQRTKEEREYLEWMNRTIVHQHGFDNVRSVIRIMNATCDSWANVSQITDESMREEVERDLAIHFS